MQDQQLSGTQRIDSIKVNYSQRNCLRSPNRRKIKNARKKGEADDETRKEERGRKADSMEKKANVRLQAVDGIPCLGNTIVLHARREDEL